MYVTKQKTKSKENMNRGDIKQALLKVQEAQGEEATKPNFFPANEEAVGRASFFWWYEQQSGRRR